MVGELIILKIPQDRKYGRVHFEPGRIVKPNELLTIEKLLRFGYDIICQKEIDLPGHHIADIIGQDEAWEIK